MKKLISICSFLCLSAFINTNLAQTATIVTGQQFGGTSLKSQTSIRKILRNATGDVFVLYAFAENITVPLSFVPPTLSWSTAIIKYDPTFSMVQGQLFLSNTQETTGVQTYPVDMTIDAQNNLYVVGYATGSSLIWSFDGETINTTPIPAETLSGNKAFMVKVTQNLQPIDAKIYSIGAAQMTSVCTSKDRIIGAGYYSSASTADFGNNVTMTKTTAYENGFVVIYDKDMSAQQLIPITTELRLYLSRVASDTAGNIFVSGNGYGTMKFGETTSHTIAAGTSSGTQYSFCASYTPDGVFRWAYALKGTGISRAEDLTVDKEGNVYMVGHQGTSGSLQWINTSGYSQPVVFAENPAKTNSSMVLLKLSGETGQIMWYNMMSSTAGNDHLGAVTTDRDGDVYVSGIVNGPANMNPNGNTYMVNEGSLTSQGVLAKYNGKDGQCVFAYASGGSSGKTNFKTAYANMLGRTQLMVAPNKNIFWGGVFERTVQFQLSGASSAYFAKATPQTTDYTDMFVMRISQQLPSSYVNKPNLHPAIKNIGYQFQFAYTELPVGAVYVAADKLPDGLSLSSDGKLSGLISKPGTYWVKIAVKDGATTLYSDTYELKVKELTADTRQVLSSQDSSFRLSLPAQQQADYALYFSVNSPDPATLAAENTISLPFSAFSDYNNMVYIKVVNNTVMPASMYLDSIFVVAFDNTNKAPGGVFGANLWMHNTIGVKTAPDSLGNQRMMKGSGWLDISGANSMNLWARKTNQAAVYGPKLMVKQLNGEPCYSFVSSDSVFVEGKEFTYFQSMFGMADFGALTATGTVLGLYEPYQYDPSANVANQLKYFFSLGSSKLYMYDAKANSNIAAQAGPNMFFAELKSDRADALLRNGAQGKTSITTSYSLRDKLMYARPILGARVRSDGQFSTLMQGEIYEVIDYPRILSDAERWKVESYMAFKYGITMYGNTIGSLTSSMRRAYYLSDGSICFDASYSGPTPNHFMFMTALVRDDVSTLHKKQASPYGNGTYNKDLPSSDTLSVILNKLVNGSDRNQPQAIANDKDYFIVASESYIYSDKQLTQELYPGETPQSYSTWKQSWFVRRSPAMNAVCIQFDLSKIPYFGDTIRAEKVGLVVMDASHGAQSTRFNYIQATSFDTLTNIAYFDGLNIPDASYMKVVYDIKEAVTISITTTVLPEGRVREHYATTITADGIGSMDFGYTIISGQLPEGLSLSSAGVLEGSPTSAANTYTFGVRATDDRGFYAEQSFQLLIAPDINCPPIAPVSYALRAGSVGETTRTSLNIKELGGYKVWSLASGSLPKGLILNGSVLTGIPEISGTQSIQVLVKDANACSGSVSFDVDVDVPKKLNAKAVTMYPNPAQGDVNLSISSITTAPVRVQIFNSTSVRVRDLSLAAGIRTARISLSGLAPGQYFVLLSSDGSIVQLLLAIK